jgi:hypothetical protein
MPKNITFAAGIGHPRRNLHKEFVDEYAEWYSPEISEILKTTKNE